MKSLLQRLLTPILVSLGIMGGAYGAFNYVSSGTYTLAGGGVGASDTTITVDNFTKPISGNQYSMASDFGSIGYLTLEPGSPTNKEFVSFTGISYSGNRATLTGVTRGLEFNYPYTASSSLRLQHSGGTKVIVSNPPQLYNQLATKQNNETISGLWTFSSTSIPLLDDNPNTTGWTALPTTTFATIGYVNDTNNTGAANSNETTLGLVEMATAAEAAAGTSAGGTGGRLAIGANITNQTCSGTMIPVTSSGKLSQTCWDFTASHAWTGLHTFSRATSTVLSIFNTLYVGTTATTTISGSATSTFASAASTTNLQISNACIGCPMGYLASSTAIAVTSGSVTYAGSIPTNANTAIVNIRMDVNGLGSYDTAVITRTGSTVSYHGLDDAADTDHGRYTVTWSGNDLIVAETLDTNANSSVPDGVVYYYK